MIEPVGLRSNRIGGAAQTHPDAEKASMSVTKKPTSRIIIECAPLPENVDEAGGNPDRVQLNEKKISVSIENYLSSSASIICCVRFCVVRTNLGC